MGGTPLRRPGAPRRTPKNLRGKIAFWFPPEENGDMYVLRLSAEDVRAIEATLDAPVVVPRALADLVAEVRARQ